MSHASISIAMCTYNGSVFLPIQLRSIAAQSQPPDELIVCDDGSADDTLSVLKAFAAEVSFPVRVFPNQERLGPAKNFEKAIGLCNGDIIVLSDQDDQWNPQKLEKLREVFEQHPDAVYAFSDAEMVDQQGALLGEKLWDAIAFRERVGRFSGAGQLKMLLKQNLVTGAAMAFRASFRDVVLPIPAGWMHDYWIVLLGSTLASGVPVSEVLFSYRRHATQAVGWRKKTFLEVCKDSLAAGQEDWSQKVENFQKLVQRVASSPRSAHSSPEGFRLLKQKELHLLKRANSRSSSGIPRVAKVLAEAVTGRYQRYSNSWYSIVRDL